MKGVEDVKGFAPALLFTFAFTSLNSFTSFSPTSIAPLAVRAVSFVDPGFDEAAAAPARVIVVVETPDSIPAAARAGVSLQVRVLGSRDRVIASQTDPFDLKTGQSDLVTSVKVPRGRYRVEATLRAGDFSAAGTAPIDIPDFTWSALSMSDVVFGSDSRNVLMADAARGLIPVAPVARHEFHPAERVSIFARVHAGRSTEFSPVTIVTTIAKTGQRPVFTDSSLVSAMPSRRTAEYRLWLPLDRIGAGEWTLTLRARSQARHATAREVTFTVK